MTTNRAELIEMLEFERMRFAAMSTLEPSYATDANIMLLAAVSLEAEERRLGGAT